MSIEKPKCLFPVANIPVILFALEFLAANKVNEVIIMSSKESRVFNSVLQTIKESHPFPKDFNVKAIKLDNPTSLAQALKDLEEMCEIKDDFILMQGDIVTNASLDEAIKMHYKGLAKVDKEKKPTPTIITKVFTEIPYSNPIRDPSQEVALMLD